MCTGYVQRVGHTEIKYAIETFNEIRLKFDEKSLNRLLFDFRGMPFTETTDRYIGYPSLVFRNEGGKLAACPMRWGLLSRDLASWDDAKKEKTLHNARSEGIAAKWPWKFPIKDRRTCLILVDWFRESGDHPEDAGKKKPRKLHYRFSAEKPMLVAGLWNETRVGDEQVVSHTMVTTAGNATVGPIHDRMPCALERDAFRDWLHADSLSDGELTDMLKVPEMPLQVSRMARYTLESDDAPEITMEKGDPKQMGLFG